MEQNKKDNSWIIIVICSILLISAIVLAFINKQNIADYLSEYIVTENDVVIYKDVDKLFLIKEKSKDDVNVRVHVSPDSLFYAKSHKEQLSIANRLNMDINIIITTNNAINTASETDFDYVSAQGWKPINWRYKTDLSDKIIKSIKDRLKSDNFSITVEWWETFLGFKQEYKKCYYLPNQHNTNPDYIINNSKVTIVDTIHIKNTIDIKEVDSIQIRARDEVVKKLKDGKYEIKFKGKPNEIYISKEAFDKLQIKH